MDVTAGYAGSVHDARMLRISSFFHNAQNGNVLDAPVENVNGTNVGPLTVDDGAYPLLPWLMKPYPHINALNRSQHRYNQQLSKARVAIEQAFGILKSRFRCSRMQLMEDISRVPQTIIAQLLHNICVMMNDEIDNEVEQENNDDDNNNPQGAMQIKEAMRQLFV